jgi:hypothetical protein
MGENDPHCLVIKNGKRAVTTHMEVGSVLARSKGRHIGFSEFISTNGKPKWLNEIPILSATRDTGLVKTYASPEGFCSTGA